MKYKFGFTLAEVIVTLAIIGVVAALVFPLTSSLRPDNNKVLYLKAYDTISNLIKDFASNKTIYPVYRQDSNAEGTMITTIDCNDYPLFNTNEPIEASNIKDRNIYKGEKKLCSLIAASLNAKADACVGVFSPSSVTYAEVFKDNTFSSQNGMLWKIGQKENSVLNGTNGIFQADIYVDVNSSESGQNCFYGESENCTKPDSFKFIVAADGSIYAADPLGQKYLETRTSLNNTSNPAASATIAQKLDDLPETMHATPLSFSLADKIEVEEKESQE